MNGYPNDDALDRALFALELEEPPADLRSSILAATVYRPAPMFSRAEIVGLSLITAAILTLIGCVIAGGGTLFAHSVRVLEDSLVRTLSSYTTLAWMAAGGATAIWLSLFPGFQSFPATASKVRKTNAR
ncbi:MAG: hypothetical protein ACYDGM_11800 [Vulcanimicrobiaceae bacterium]